MVGSVVRLHLEEVAEVKMVKSFVRSVLDSSAERSFGPFDVLFEVAQEVAEVVPSEPEGRISLHRAPINGFVEKVGQERGRYLVGAGLSGVESRRAWCRACARSWFHSERARPV